MPRFFLSGLINIETNLAIDGFPLEYFPVRYLFNVIQTTVSGVGFNTAAALTALGNQVKFASLIGPDDNGSLARKALKNAEIPDEMVLEQSSATAQSVVLYNPEGRRQIHVDLKDIQGFIYPEEVAQKALVKSDMAVLCNINFSRNLISLAEDSGIPIATDVHDLSDVDDDYNKDFMASAAILFLSDACLQGTPETVAKALLARYGIEIVVIGLGEKGALLAVRQDEFMGRFPPVFTRPVVNTIGAGDALFSAFLDRYLRFGDPYRALQEAMVFASYKIGEKGAAEGFLGGKELDDWVAKIKDKE
ncbi:MAG: carbohydrate kinase family protein [Brevefilum sp.]